jgi:hypothetical protein
MGVKSARIELPLLHPDHIRQGVNVLQWLAGELNEIARRQSTNVTKVIEARIAFHSANLILREYASDDIERAGEEVRIELERKL